MIHQRRTPEREVKIPTPHKPALLSSCTHLEVVLVARLEKVQGGKRVQPATESQSSQDQWTKADKKETRGRDVTRSFHEAGLQINDKKVSWQKGLKESQRR